MFCRSLIQGISGAFVRSSSEELMVFMSIWFRLTQMLAILHSVILIIYLCTLTLWVWKQSSHCQRHSRFVARCFFSSLQLWCLIKEKHDLNAVLSCPSRWSWVKYMRPDWWAVQKLQSENELLYGHVNELRLYHPSYTT